MYGHLSCNCYILMYGQWLFRSFISFNHHYMHFVRYVLSANNVTQTTILTKPSHRFYGKLRKLQGVKQHKALVDRYTTNVCEDKRGDIAVIPSGAPPLYTGTKLITLHDSFATLCQAYTTRRMEGFDPLS